MNHTPQVPDDVSDAAAVFAEPLAAACRIVEQGLAPPEAKAAVLGDGKLGLLVAEVLARRKTTCVEPAPAPNAGGDGGTGGAVEGGLGTTTIIGRHDNKMKLCCSGGGGAGGPERGEVRVYST